MKLPVILDDVSIDSSVALVQICNSLNFLGSGSIKFGSDT